MATLLVAEMVFVAEELILTHDINHDMNIFTFIFTPATSSRVHVFLSQVNVAVVQTLILWFCRILDVPRTTSATTVAISNGDNEVLAECEVVGHHGEAV